MFAKVFSIILFCVSIVVAQAINIATPTNGGAWHYVSWYNLMPNANHPDNTEFASYIINLNKDLTLGISVDVEGLDVTADNLSFSILNGGNLFIENRIDVNNHNFTINLLSGGKLSCNGFEGFNAYEGRVFNMNFWGGEFVYEGSHIWLRSSALISWNFGGMYEGVFYPAKPMSLSSNCLIKFGSMLGGRNLVNFNLSKENAISSFKALTPERAIIFCRDCVNINSFGYDFSQIKFGDLKSGKYYFALISSKNDVDIQSANYRAENLPTHFKSCSVLKKQTQNKFGEDVFLLCLEVDMR